MHTEGRHKADWHLLYFQRSLQFFFLIFKGLLFPTAWLQEKGSEIFLGKLATEAKEDFLKWKQKK